MSLHKSITSLKRMAPRGGLYPPFSDYLSRRYVSPAAAGTQGFDQSIRTPPGSWPPGGLRKIERRMSRLDIGDYLGLTIETALRIFTRLKDKSVIRLLGLRGIEILKQDELLNMGNNAPRSSNVTRKGTVHAA
ncbi:helix-turn-helix domain-containing protein [Mesorhizobium sp. Cs1321R2N1]|uniref:helix-turn-helix domain-containing protein n=1 Tax=Mesorhizobium sp. Cs1321R2N1 TaxID=3015174 RepID=UPI00301DC84F